MIRFDSCAGRAAEEPKPSTRFERCDRPLGGRHLRLHDSEATAERQRRAGVTEALQGLARKGLVSAKRGQIVVNDRGGLVAKANGYGIPESEYLRLTGWKPRH